MKIVCISDSHGYLPDDLPECDLIIHAGDIAPFVDHSVVFQRAWFESTFATWMKEHGKPVVMVGGNHDFVFQADDNFGNHLSGLIPNLIYLQDSMVELYNDAKSQPLKIWGSPWSLNFGPWAFMTSELMLATKYDDIPHDIDIIISHSPPFQKRDRAADGRLCGSHELARAIRRKLPELVVCGHIHEGYGVVRYAGAKIINCSLLDECYEPSNLPIVVEV
jgi:Icc-related predicted phosphoesterase